MSQWENDTTTLDEQRATLQETEKLAAMPLGDVLDLASSVTEALGAMVLAAEQAGAWEQAAALCDEVAIAWQTLSDVLSADIRPQLRSVADYWTARAAEERLRASARMMERPVEPPPRQETRSAEFRSPTAGRVAVDLISSSTDKKTLADRMATFTRSKSSLSVPLKDVKISFEKPTRKNLKQQLHEDDDRDKEDWQ